MDIPRQYISWLVYTLLWLIISYAIYFCIKHGVIITPPFLDIYAGVSVFEGLSQWKMRRSINAIEAIRQELSHRIPEIQALNFDETKNTKDMLHATQDISALTQAFASREKYVDLLFMIRNISFALILGLSFILLIKPSITACAFWVNTPAHILAPQLLFSSILAYMLIKSYMLARIYCANHTLNKHGVKDPIAEQGVQSADALKENTNCSKN